ALHASAARRHSLAGTRIQRSPPWMCSPTMASPSAAFSSSRTCWRAALAAAYWSCCSSVCSSVSADDNGVPSPTLGHVLCLDALLEEDDALEQRLGAGRAPGDVDVDGDDLVDAFGHRVRVPVGAAAVGARPHRDDVLRVRHLLVQP